MGVAGALGARQRRGYGWAARWAARNSRRTCNNTSDIGKSMLYGTQEAEQRFRLHTTIDDETRMTGRRWAARCIPLMLLLLSATAAQAASSEVWLSGVPPFVRQKMFQESDSDYMSLFKPDAPWAKSAQVVKVFMINGGLVMHQSDDELKAVFADLKRRHIALAIEMGLLSGKDSAGQQVCGVGVEGFAAPDNAKVVANRIQRAGGELAYVAMDEPLWYAHHFSGKNACGWSAEDVARDIVPRVAALREKFPAVQIGDIEPVGTAQPADWVEEITQWTQVYRQVAGEPLSFFHADVAWSGPWQQQLPAVKSRIRAAGLKFGIIYDGGGSEDESDDVWTQEAEQRFRLIESNPSMIPDHAIIQTWARWPKKMLPEDQPGTLTYLVLKYSKGR